MAYLTAAPLSWDRVVSLNRWATQNGCGAVVTFVGVVRADRDPSTLPPAGGIAQCFDFAQHGEPVEPDSAPRPLPVGLHGRRAVRALCYEAYPEMAEPLIHRLVNEAQARWSLEDVQVQHRLGLVEVGQISVAVVVAAQHRTQAYAASQFLIERIKHEVPIWKREQYEDGTSQWIVGAPELLEVAEPSGADHAHSILRQAQDRGEPRRTTTSLRAMVSERSESNHAHV